MAEPPRSALPDLFETEINEMMSDIKTILTYNNFPGETDLFLKERWRHMVHFEFLDKFEVRFSDN